MVGLTEGKKCTRDSLNICAVPLRCTSCPENDDAKVASYQCLGKATDASAGNKSKGMLYYSAISS